MITKTKPTGATLRLVFPGYKLNDLPKASAIARHVRETATQYIVRRENVEITYSNGVRFGAKEVRFSKATGCSIPYTPDMWRVAALEPTP